MSGAGDTPGNGSRNGSRNGSDDGSDSSNANRLKSPDGTDYEFEWDDTKAASNLAKHGVNFREAMAVVGDPLALTMFDDEHSDDEERWVSIGRAVDGALLLVIHTFVGTGPSTALVRLISARPVTRSERLQYEQGHS
jgi:uncharacterized protein